MFEELSCNKSELPILDEEKMSNNKQIYKTAQKFFSESESDVTIVLHSNAILNNDIAHLADKMKPGALVIDSRFIKLTTGEVRDMILMPDSLFRKAYNTRIDFESALSEFDNYIDQMDDGIFRVHYIRKLALRTIIEQTIRIEWSAVAKYFDAINDRDILIVDDDTAGNDSVIYVRKEILTYYSPKSITALTLFADKFDNKTQKNINFEGELLT